MFKFYDVSGRTNTELYRPRLVRRRGIVVHETIGYDSLPYLQGGSLLDGRKVSSDYHIARNGDVSQITPPRCYSFHSGVARWQLYQESDRTINQGFVGVELENHPDDGQVVTGPQYIGLAWLIRVLCTSHPIDLRNVVGHYQVALPSGRKKDPVTMNWTMLTTELIRPSVTASGYIVGGELS